MLNRSHSSQVGLVSIVNPKMSSRTSVYGMSPPITHYDGHTRGSRLPTCEQVLRCYWFNCQNPTLTNQTHRVSAKIVVRELLPFYKKAPIPTITEKKVEKKIISLATRNAKLRAIPVGRRNSKSSRRKLLDEEKRLKTTFAIWPADVESRLVHEHDVLFLNSM